MSGLFLRYSLTLLVALLVFAAPASAALRVVATTNSLGMLAAEIGGEQVQVRVLAPADRDVHYLDARPSYMAALRRADLLLEMGAGLEEGWLPAAVQGAANPAINRGRPGRLRAADHLELRQSITTKGPHTGHVHAEGNPHFNADPARMAQLAGVVGQRLAQLQPEHAERFSHAATRLAEQLLAEAGRLAGEAPQGRAFVAYHEDLDYLEEWLPVRVVGYLEPLPGIPPTARHLTQLTSRLEAEQGVVLFAVFQPDRGARFLQERIGWPGRAVPLEPREPTLDSYLALLRYWAQALSADL